VIKPKKMSSFLFYIICGNTKHMSIYVLVLKRLPFLENCLCHNNAGAVLSGNKGRKSPYSQKMCNLKGEKSGRTSND
jgi:hypothetical protein